MIMHHLSLEEIIELAATGGEHPHLAACAFCREQLEAMQALENFDAQTDDEAGSADIPVNVYRLAAATPATDETIRLRRAWFLENGTVVVRVMEDAGDGTLVGFVLSDPSQHADIRIRFSGLEHVFTPDASGRFVIGPSSIDIESMDANLDPPGFLRTDSPLP
jgi:hypothetical protein